MEHNPVSINRKNDAYQPTDMEEQAKYNKLIQKITDNPFAISQTEEEKEAELLASELINDKQQRFCLNYVECFNAAKAAADAGYSVKSAAAIGYALLRKPEIQTYIESLRQINSHKYRHAVLDELHDLYLQAKQGDIQYSIQNRDGIVVAIPIMAERPDGTLSILRDKPNYKVALETLRTIAEYTIPKPTSSSPTDKLAVANKYIQNNTYQLTPLQQQQQMVQQQLINQHIMNTINNKQ